MQYRKFERSGVKASVLGFGCMRLPVQAGVEGDPIDRPEAIRMIRKAIDSGVTYVDTAYGYHNGDSENLVGEALQDGYRERVLLATKLPVWKVEKYEDMERLLDEQLTKLKTDHVDFYLLHALDKARFHQMRDLNVFKFLDDMVAKGKIKYPAFSFHDNAEAFREIVDSYPWHMAQIQMNVLDEFNQATLEGMKYAASKGIGIVIMEPLRGGALAAKLPEEIRALYEKAPVKRSAVEWAFRWLYDQPEIMTILSGMSSMEQLEDNLKIFEGALPGTMTADEKELMTQVRLAYESRVRVGCTGCEYCMPCPAGVQIPKIFRNLDSNAMFDTLDKFSGFYNKLVSEGHGADQCVKCGACESVCPQHFDIRDKLESIHKEFAQ